MSLIEKAAKRLEELRRAGFDAAGATSNTVAATPRGGTAPSLIERAAAQAALHAAQPAATNGAKQGAAPVGTPLSTPTHSPALSRRMNVDLARLAAAGVVTPDAPRSQIADEFRVIKRPLILNATGKSAAPITHGNLIMITSALPGEGKSFTALNLAMSIAMELDHTVLLVDADVARPSLLNILGWPPMKGLLDVLVDDKVDLRDVLIRTDIDNLSILPSGTSNRRATELLASDSMERLLEDMSHRYADRIIVFDSPPLLVTTESRVLATHMGQVVVVVEAQHTQQGAVKQALATIEACPIRLMMLNKSRTASAGGGYGYGYGYGYSG
ncbi:MAG: XrtA-associated tyrosine autokinase [Casimicrobiaceae bacterium]